MKSKTKSQCDYGNHITGKCIGGHLRIGNHSDYYDYSDDVMPCPACNAEEWLKKYRAEYIDDGINYGQKGKKINTKEYTSSIPNEIKANHGAVRKIYRWLKRGYYYGLKNRH